MQQPAVPTPKDIAPSQRLASIDVYRGLVMLLLVFLDAPNGWTGAVKEGYPDAPVVQALTRQFEHVEWAGLVLWDMIQPSFMFMVGVALPYSRV